MNVFNKVTLQSLKKNKTRTIVTIIGIILSAAMICAVTTFASSIYNYALDNAIYVDGDWHGSAEDMSLETYEMIKNESKVSNHVFAQQLGYAKIEGCINENKPYLFVLGASEGFSDMMPVHITSGKYPTSSSEILIPDHLYENGGVELNIGDTIEFALGKRMLDGYSIGQYTPYYIYDENNETIPNGEKLVVDETRSYTVVGFYERPSFENFTAPGYTALTIADKDTNAQYNYSVWFKMNKAKEVYSFIEENQLTGRTNSSVLRYSGISRYEGFNSMIISLAVIVIALIMFGSIALIYNAFSISVAERTKQFGLLSSVGATKKQLRRMVVSEALMVSTVGIPLGILAGVGGIGITLLFVGNKFKALIGYPIPLKLSVSGLSLVIAVVIALLTVLISAIVPSKRATKVSAIEAIRQSKDINAKIKKVRTSKLIYKIFGLPGMLANKYYKRSRKKYRATVLSLFMSVVLFVSASAFTGALTESVSDSFGNVGYDILIYGYENEFEKATVDDLLSELKSSKGVNKVAYAQSSGYYVNVSPNEISKDYLDYYSAAEDLQIAEIENVGVYTTIKFVDDSAYRDLLKTHKLNEEEYFNPDAPKAVAVDGRVLFDSVLGKYTSYNVLKSENTAINFIVEKEFDGYYFEGERIDDNGNQIYVYKSKDNPDEKMELTAEEALEEKKIDVGKIIYEAPFYLDVNSRLTMIYPMSLRDNVLSVETMLNSGYNYYITTDTHVETMGAVEDVLSNLSLSKLRVRDVAADEEENRNIVTIIQVFAYGFIVLISMIAAANVFNTISTNVALRRREFAMLKSVGMTAKGFNRMMNFECILYGTRSLLFGLPVSIGVSYLIHLAVSEGYQKDFTLPWVAIGIAVLSVFLVVFVTMMYSMSKINKDNPIDALKNENL